MGWGGREEGRVSWQTQGRCQATIRDEGLGSGLWASQAGEEIKTELQTHVSQEAAGREPRCELSHRPEGKAPFMAHEAKATCRGLG